MKIEITQLQRTFQVAVLNRPHASKSNATVLRIDIGGGHSHYFLKSRFASNYLGPSIMS